MRYALSYFIPVVQEDVSNLFPRTGYANHVSSSGYYGYQTVTNKPVSNHQNTEDMDTQTFEINIQFKNYIADEIKISNQNIRGQDHRKRAWEYGADAPDSKKRRENGKSRKILNLWLQNFHNILEAVISTPENAATTKCINLRQPTHNIPDLPRSIMGHYI